MRIITGKYKGRRFDIPRTFKARPTTDFAKENIFNVLSAYLDFDGMSALDLFSGTGSISLELLSRGCADVTCVEIDRDHHAFIVSCLRKLDIRNCTPLRTDAFKFIKACKRQYDLVFADPPYAIKELPEIPNRIFERGILKPEGILVLEHGRDYDFSSHPNFVEHRAYGSVNFSIFRASHSENR